MNTQKVTQEYRMNQWIGIVRECRERGQTVVSWCKEHKLKPENTTIGFRKYVQQPTKRFPKLTMKKELFL